MHVSEAFALAVRLAVRRGVRGAGRASGQHHVVVGPWTLVFYGRDVTQGPTPYAVPPDYCVVVMRAGIPVGLVYPTGGQMLSSNADSSEEEDAVIAALRSALSDSASEEIRSP